MLAQAFLAQTILAQTCELLTGPFMEVDDELDLGLEPALPVNLEDECDFPEVEPGPARRRRRGAHPGNPRAPAEQGTLGVWFLQGPYEAAASSAGPDPGSGSAEGRRVLGLGECRWSFRTEVIGPDVVGAARGGRSRAQKPWGYTVYDLVQSWLLDEAFDKVVVAEMPSEKAARTHQQALAGTKGLLHGKAYALSSKRMQHTYRWLLTPWRISL